MGEKSIFWVEASSKSSRNYFFYPNKTILTKSPQARRENFSFSPNAIDRPWTKVFFYKGQENFQQRQEKLKTLVYFPLMYNFPSVKLL